MNLPTIEELDRIGAEAAGWPKHVRREFDDQVARYVTAIRDAVVAACRPQLRPIEEMPKEVPDGCVRVYWKSKTKPSTLRKTDDTHYIDIALPPPTYPADFEASFAESKLDAKDKDAAFELWKKGGAQ
jgi:hypothetical protein